MLHEILDRTQKYMFWSKSFTTADINPRPRLEESMTKTLPLISSQPAPIELVELNQSQVCETHRNGRIQSSLLRQGHSGADNGWV